MKPIEVSYSHKNEDGTTFSGKVTYTMPEGVAEKVEKWGEKVVDQKAEASVIIALQNLCRNAESEEEAQKLADGYVPGIGRERATSGTSKKAIMEALKALTPEQIAELLASAKAQTPMS